MCLGLRITVVVITVCSIAHGPKTYAAVSNPVTDSHQNSDPGREIGTVEVENDSGYLCSITRQLIPHSYTRFISICVQNEEGKTYVPTSLEDICNSADGRTDSDTMVVPIVNATKYDNDISYELELHQEHFKALKYLQLVKNQKVFYYTDNKYDYVQCDYSKEPAEGEYFRDRHIVYSVIETFENEEFQMGHLCSSVDTKPGFSVAGDESDLKLYLPEKCFP